MRKGRGLRGTKSFTIKRGAFVGCDITFLEERWRGIKERDWNKTEKKRKAGRKKRDREE